MELVVANDPTPSVSKKFAKNPTPTCAGKLGLSPGVGLFALERTSDAIHTTVNTTVSAASAIKSPFLGSITCNMRHSRPSVNLRCRMPGWGSTVAPGRQPNEPRPPRSPPAVGVAFRCTAFIFDFAREKGMSHVVYISKSTLERKQGPLRIAHLPGESQPVIFSVHGAIAEHYKVDPAKLKESHSSTIDYVISATAG